MKQQTLFSQVSFIVSACFLLLLVQEYPVNAQGTDTLSIWDSVEGTSVQVSQLVTIYAQYTDGAQHIPGAYCNITFDESYGTMVDTGTNYEYSRSFTTAGTKTYAISCRKEGHEWLSASDDLEVQGTISCGNNVKEHGEACDGTDLNGYACSTVAAGFISGSLSCLPDCSGFNTSQCVQGNIVQADSCSQTDIQAAINAASAGDIVVVPPGDCTISSPVNINKSILLQGSGIDVTTLTCHVSFASACFQVPDGTHHVRITGFTLDGDVENYNNFMAIRIGVSGGAQGCHDFRIDHNKFVDFRRDTFGGGYIIETFGYTYGVMDHNSYTDCTGEAIVVTSHGSGSYRKDMTLGGYKNGTVFFEDNQYILTGAAEYDADVVIDAGDGARYVFRYNYVNDTDQSRMTNPVDLHGFCTCHSRCQAGGDQRGTLSYEVYENTLITNRMDGRVYSRGFNLRGGEGVIYNNTLTGNWEPSSIYYLIYERSFDYADGHCQVDLYAVPLYEDQCHVDSDNGGPLTNEGLFDGELIFGQCLDQPNDLYFWNNRLNGAETTSANLRIAYNPADPSDYQNLDIVEGRNYFFAEKPDYIPYPHPHPLTQIDNSVPVGGLIIDHESTDIAQIPEYWITQAKQTLHIAHAHTSHGSQLTDGMTALVGFANNGGLGLALPQDIFAYNHGGTSGALDYRDYNANAGSDHQFVAWGARDLGSSFDAPGGTIIIDRERWAADTRSFLNAHPEVNVIVWAWCWHLNSATEQEVDLYLNLMNALEADYPNVKFVYMTAHLNGLGEGGTLHRNNERIRNYVRLNNKILYDFADIESYDPEGNYYVDRLGDDACNYDADGDGVLETLPASAETDWKILPDIAAGDRNWAIDWQDTHTEGADWYECYAAHSQPLNANRKAYAAWWLWARLAGWDGSTTSPLECTTAGGCPDMGCNTKACVDNQCVYTPVADGTSCDNGLYCDGIDQCQAGSCTHAGNPCSDDGYACTTITCNEITDSCETTPDHAGCDDSNVCTINDRCIGAGGDANGCAYDYADSSVSCDDGYPCTQSDVCNGVGTCQGAPNHALCLPGFDECTSAICNPAAYPATGCGDYQPLGCDADPGLEVWLRCDDALSDGIATDSSGNNHPGVCTPGAYCPVYGSSTGYENGGYYFDGQDTRLTVGTGSDFSDLCLNGCSFMAWVNGSDALSSSTGTIIGRWDWTRYFFRLYFDKYGRVGFIIDDNGDATENCAVLSSRTVASFEYDTWQHVAGVYTGTEAIVYLNGAEMARTTCSWGSLDQTAWQNAEDTLIGLNDDDNFNYDMIGTLDEVRIYNRALSAAEILAIITEPSPTPTPTATSTVTPTATPTPPNAYLLWTR